MEKEKNIIDNENISVDIHEDNKGNQCIKADDLMSYFKWERKWGIKSITYVVMVIVVFFLILWILSKFIPELSVYF